MLGGGHLGEMKLAVVPGDHVACSRDANGHFAVFTLDFANGENFKKLRVKRTAIELKDQIRYPRSKRESIHVTIQPFTST
jgi:hypothetical protein